MTSIGSSKMVWKQIYFIATKLSRVSKIVLNFNVWCWDLVFNYKTFDLIPIVKFILVQELKVVILVFVWGSGKCEETHITIHQIQVGY
jgi:hypothetical protein